MQSQKPLDTADGQDFSVEIIRNALESTVNENAPGKDGIPGEVH